MSEKFKRNKEDFTCEKCGLFVIGDGYTNHCPQCLWSKHVDIYPGDRKASCGGLMRPIVIEKEGKDTILTNECTVCLYKKRNKLSLKDNYEEVLRVVRNQVSSK